MNTTQAVENYVAVKLAPGFQLTLELDRSRDIEAERQNRCLSPVGEAFFADAVFGYLAGYREEAQELVSKASAFLELAHSIDEKQKYSYSPGFSEGLRSTDLSYVNWLKTGAMDVALLAEARTLFDSHYRDPGTLDRKTADYAAPRLLYLGAYELIMSIAQRLGIDTDPSGRARVRGLFGHALRIATASDELARETEKAKVKKVLGKQLFDWISHGQYSAVAYALRALFPTPDGPPFRLIEGCWNHISDDLIKRWLTTGPEAPRGQAR
jgi:hypothetical protein